MDAVHPRVLGYLGRALSLELSAVQQYMTQASLVELWGDQDAATRFRQETVEEMRHAESIVQRMLALGVAPAASQLRPAAHGPDLASLLRQDAQLEQDLIQLYGDAVRFCVLIGDGLHRDFFTGLLDDEQHHAQDIDSWLLQLGANASGESWHLQRATF
ncbi:MAG: ferritin-like domain-containing protein [Cyanobacteriota bacterium]|nr:ferritin-like domain-containing protein [Cyanobacteriota bacterium]